MYLDDPVALYVPTRARQFSLSEAAFNILRFKCQPAVSMVVTLTAAAKLAFSWLAEMYGS